MAIEDILIILLPTMVGAGILWATSGALVNYIKHLQMTNQNKADWVDPDWKGFQTKKLGKDVLLGLILGSMGAGYMLWQEVPIPDITTFGAFAALMIANFGIIAMVDKWLIGGLAAFFQRNKTT